MNTDHLNTDSPLTFHYPFFDKTGEYVDTWITDGRPTWSIQEMEPTPDLDELVKQDSSPFATAPARRREPG